MMKMNRSVFSPGARHDSRPGRPWVEAGVTSINGNGSWATIQALLPLVTTSLLCVQEHGVLDHMVAGVSGKLFKAGWKSVWLPARATEAGGRSAGVAILAKSFVDLGADDGVPKQVVPHRLLATAVGLKGIGKLIIYSAYGMVSEGMGDFNRSMLVELLSHSQAHGLPWLALGDWNNPPEVLLQAFGDLQLGSGVVVVAPTEDTYVTTLSRSTIDYAVMDRRARLLCKQLEVEDTIPLAPHAAVRMLWVGQPHLQKVLIPGDAPRLPLAAPFGPRNKQPIWDGELEEAGVLLQKVQASWEQGGCKVSAALRAEWEHPFEEFFDRWHAKAAGELVGILGVPGRGQAERLGRPDCLQETTLVQAMRDNRPKQADKLLALKWVKGRFNLICQALAKWGDALARNALGLQLVGRGTEAHWAGLARRLAERTLVMASMRRDGPLCRGLGPSGAAWRMMTKEVAGWVFLLGGAPGWKHVDSLLDIYQQLMVMMGKLVAQVTAARAKERRRGWQDWVDNALEGAAGLGHRFSKEPVCWKPQMAAREHCQSSCPQDLIEDDRRIWKGIWKASEANERWEPEDQGFEDWMHEGPSALLPLLQVEDLRKAAQSFKLRTCATDGWHPRHYGLLCDDALAVLARVLWLVELFGDFPKKTRGLQVRLITAKRRPIGWYKGLFRVWAASRRKLVRLWEEKWAGQACFNTGAGKAVGDGVWRAAVRSNLEVDKGRHYAEVLYDVRKCFENVNFSTLRRNAAAVGYPEVLLRVSLHSYRWQRTICDGVLAVLPLRATRQAIVAGSAFATFELKALFVLPMIGHMRRIPEARALLHVDDLAAGVSSGTLAGLERGLVVLHTDLKGVFQELGLPLAEDKLALIASSRAAMTRLRANRVLRDLLPEQAVKKLGYDYVAGNRAAKGRSHVRRGRIQAAMGRLKRIHRLRRASGKQSKLVYTGAIPAAFYGSEVTGCPPSRLHCFRARAASVCGLGGGGGANLDLVWQLARRGGVNDPGAQVLVAPLVRYVKEWWLQASEKASLRRVALRPEELLEGFRQAQCRLAKSTNWTKISYDPIALALLAASKVGWTWKNAIEFIDHDGQPRNIALASPAAVRQLYHEAWEKRATCGALLRLRKDLVPATELRALETDGIWLEPVRKVLFQKGREAISCKAKACLRAAFTGKDWTGAALARRGYCISGVCFHPECGQPDTLFHRISPACTSRKSERRMCQHGCSSRPRGTVPVLWGRSGAGGPTCVGRPTLAGRRSGTGASLTRTGRSGCRRPPCSDPKTALSTWMAVLWTRCGPALPLLAWRECKSTAEAAGFGPSRLRRREAGGSQRPWQRGWLPWCFWSGLPVPCGPSRTAWASFRLGSAPAPRRSLAVSGQATGVTSSLRMPRRLRVDGSTSSRQRPTGSSLTTWTMTW